MWRFGVLWHVLYVDEAAREPVGRESWRTPERRRDVRKGEKKICRFEVN
jgi:hypothetical protein